MDGFVHVENINSCMIKALIDCEVYTNYFLLGVRDFKTKEKISFEISEFIDQRKELSKFLSTFSGYWISFNGIHYDNMVLAHGQINNWFLSETPLRACADLKMFSDRIINAEEADFGKFNREKYFKWKFTNIDLYLYWSKLLRLSRKISLKSLGIQLGYPVVQELPFDPGMILDESQIKELKHYNLEHDLGILDLLTDAMNDDILLRQTVSSQSGLNLWSADAPKIASELLLQDKCRQTGESTDEVRRMRFEKPHIRFSELFKGFDPRFKTLQLQELYDELLNSSNYFSKEFAMFNPSGKGIKMSFSVGGIHAVNKNEEYFANDEYVIIDSDIESLYPRLIELLQVFRFPEVNKRYCEIKHLRVTESKPNYKKAKLTGDADSIQYWKLQDEFYKLCLNSTSGLIDMEHSWLYNPEMILKLRLTGQLILLRCIEASQLEDWHVFSSNTDGLTVRLPRKDLDKYIAMIDKIGEEFQVKFEHETFKSIHYQNVNSYIAITELGAVKKKGDFLTKPVLSTSCNNLIIPKMLQCYFEKGIRPEEIIKSLDTFTYTWDKEVGPKKLHIYDFCASQKCDKSYTVEWMGKKQQRLNRYYVSRAGGFLYKCRDNKKSHMLKNWGVMIYNNHTDQPLSKYNIDFRFYVSAVNEMIAELQAGQNQYKLW